MVASWLAVLLVLFSRHASDEGLLVNAATGDVFTNTFYVKLNGERGNDVAHEIAQRAGFENLGPVSTHSCRLLTEVNTIALLC